MTDDDTKKDAFKRRLKAIIKKKGLTQSDVARLAGLERNRISTYVRGVSLPRDLYLQKLAEGLGVKQSDLLPDEQLSDARSPVRMEFSSDHSKVRITVDTWLPTAIGTEIIKQIGEHAIIDRE